METFFFQCSAKLSRHRQKAAKSQMLSELKDASKKKAHEETKNLELQKEFESWKFSLDDILKEVIDKVGEDDKELKTILDEKNRTIPANLK